MWLDPEVKQMSEYFENIIVSFLLFLQHLLYRGIKKLVESFLLIDINI